MDYLDKRYAGQFDDYDYWMADTDAMGCRSGGREA